MPGSSIKNRNIAYQKARSLASEGKLSETEKILEQLSIANGLDEEALNSLGRLYYLRKDWASAEIVIARCYSLNNSIENLRFYVEILENLSVAADNLIISQIDKDPNNAEYYDVYFAHVLKTNPEKDAQIKL